MDRDGTILKDGRYLSDPDAIRIYKGVVPALKKLDGEGWKLIIGTNQSGIGRGYFGLEALEKTHDRLLRMFRKEKVRICDIFFCPHHPDAGCDCRKPAVGMLLEAARRHRLDLSRCVVVGDKPSDIEWGRKGGARTVLVLTGSGRKSRKKLKRPPDHVAPNFSLAADWILKNG